MRENQTLSALCLGFFIFSGLFVFGYMIGSAVIQFKEYERTVTVKGLSAREYSADIILWPIQFMEASKDLGKIYESIEANTAKITQFLKERGVDPSEISYSAPAITDKLAQQWGGKKADFRYTASQTVTVYSQKVEVVRSIMRSLSELGKQGIVFTSGNYETQTEYLFTRLNDIKPEMIEEATKKAREVALKFAQDSQSKLGKIKRASQGQFSISPRDKNNPHIKKIRVVSTVEYYLSD